MTPPLPPIIAKVGGSLYDLPDLGPRLNAWLAQQQGDVIVVPGGGPAVEALRQLDQTHGLGEEACHWLALRLLTINAHFLVHLLPGAKIIGHVHERGEGGINIMDMFPFALADEASPGRLPHCWDVTSDSLALRLAIVAGARRLVLLKSVHPPGPGFLGAGIVDDYFQEALRQAPADLQIQCVNLRA